MLFAKLALLALPFLGLAVSSPIEKRDTSTDVLAIVTTLQSSVSGPTSQLPLLTTVDDVAAQLTEIKTAINVAVAAVQAIPVDSAAAKKRQANDLNVLGAVLANVINEVITAVEAIAIDLEAAPLIGAIIIDIDGGLNTLLLGVQILLAGVLAIVSGLLVGVAGLLASLGLGLFPLTLGTLAL